MAAELCKVSLWLEALEPGKPLSFLDHHIRVGNSLIGTTPDLIANGVPNDTFKPIAGDDKKVCTVLKKLNARERKGFGELFVREDATNFENIRRAALAINKLSDDTPENLRQKESAWSEAHHSYAYLRARELADTWCAAFVIQKAFKSGTMHPIGITQSHITNLAEGDSVQTELKSEVQRLTNQYQFFHWHLEFPDVFGAVGKGGFDVSLSNPPWEHTELKEKEWFAERRPEIANAPTGAKRKAIIQALKQEDPLLWTQFEAAARQHNGVSHFLGNSGRFPLCGRGRINHFAVFAELMRSLLSLYGQMGAVLPTGIATDDTTKLFFQDIVTQRSLVSLYNF
jgi:hypothetical protein